MFIRLMLLTAFCTLFIPHSASASEYALHELFRLALEGSETIKIAEEEFTLSEIGKDKALSGLLPTLSAFGYHTHYSDDKIKNGLILQPEYTDEWGLRLDQTLSLSGKEFRAYSVSRDEIRKSSQDLSAVKEDYLLTVANQYYTLLVAGRAIEISEANIERLTKQRDAAQKRLEVGEATKTVLLRAEAELAGAVTERIKALNTEQIARTRLAKTVGIKGAFSVLEPASVSAPVTPGMADRDIAPLKGDCTLATLDCLKEVSLNARAELKSLFIQKDVDQERVTIAQGGYWPDLSLEGVYLRQENEPASSFGLSERAYGALKLNFPFFEGGLRKAEVAEARARMRQTEYRLEDRKNSVMVEVENSYLLVLREASVLQQVEAEVAYARDNYNLVSKQFQYGLADSLDVIDANTLLVTAERELINAKYRYHLALLRLQRATGTLLTSVLNGQQEYQ